MNKDIISHLNNSKLFSKIDIHFAGFISRFSTNRDPDIFLGAVLVSRATSNGDICLDLRSVSDTVLLEKQKNSDPVVCPPLARWREKLHSSPAVGKPGDKCPLILDDRYRLYLYRYWEYENKLSSAIRKRVEEEPRQNNFRELKQSLKRLFPDNGDETNWQKVAAAIAILKGFCVITGGPGSGKTFTIAGILALMLEYAPRNKLNIFLAAPTGKAAARLGESIKQAKQVIDTGDHIKNAIPKDVYTVHRLLRPIAGTPYFRRNSENPLPADVVVVDEASMVDLALMSKLVQAVAVNTRLLLVGDKDQLASVEAGSVLGDICDRQVIHGFSKKFFKKIEEFAGLKQGDAIRLTESGSGLQDCICVLQKNYRFSARRGIGKLSRAINHGDVDSSLTILKNPSEASATWHDYRSSSSLTRNLVRMIIDGYRKYLTIKDPMLAMDAFCRFKIMCALKIGPFGVNAINNLAERALGEQNLIADHRSGDRPWYRGRPVLITRNDYNLGLFNGDIGITLPDPDASTDASNDEFHVYFTDASGGVRRFPVHRLPEHETVWAMTVHKSQGSEFDDVVLILPDKDYPLLTRELIYTGLTRARHKVSIWGSESVLKTAISRKVERTSGLRDVLWKEQ
jgi:exodeoxyribonuclease V alpha subunit